MTSNVNFFFFIIIFFTCLLIYLKFRKRKKVIYIVSFPKCGRTWLKYILNKVFIDYYKLQNVEEDSINLKYLAKKKHKNSFDNRHT